MRLVSVMILALAVVGAAAFAFLPAPIRDGYVIALRRHYNVWLASTGQPLPGTPELALLEGRLRDKGMALGSPILMRIFKRDFELEVWMLKNSRYELFAIYPICKWSGRLGPKLATGDRQAPEGFYSVDRAALNPNSRWHRSFNLGFPNPYDRSHDRSGSFLMVHGGCGSIGCYAMTNPVIDEIWTLINRAFDGGQKRFQAQVFPFRMTAANLARYDGTQWSQFWANLKTGHDLFERERLPPAVGLCQKRYTFVSGLKTSDVTGPVSAECLAANNTTALIHIPPQGSAPDPVFKR